MPTYEYKCSACGYAFERFHSIMAAPIKKCPECGKSKVKRLLGTGAGLIFKGSGFYITDYRSDAYQQAAKNDSATGGGESKPDAASSAGESKAEKGDAKSGAKDESKSGATSESKSAAPAKNETPPKPAPKKKK
jgi:putative FmdB family regulatory protein